jgi:hypothetical protein
MKHVCTLYAVRIWTDQMNESLELVNRKFIFRWVVHVLTNTVLSVFHISVRNDLKLCDSK